MNDINDERDWYKKIDFTNEEVPIQEIVEEIEYLNDEFFSNVDHSILWK